MSLNTPFLLNAWYAAAWDYEVGDKPLARMLLGTRVALYRRGDGEYAALEDRCAHRLVPLSCGRVEGDTLECAYHGLRFDAAGQCVTNPHGPIPTAARVKSFAARQRHGMVWIWLGDAALADDGAIPDFGFMDDDALNARRIRGHMHTRAGYTLMADNILDLGHIEFLHGGTLGTEAVRKAPTQVREEGDSIIVEREIENEILPEFMSREYGCVGLPVRRLLSVRWQAPANLKITISVAPMGGEAETRSNYSCHLMTPETLTTTHYFWANTRLGNPSEALDAAKRRGLESVFSQEDKPIVEAQQKNIDVDGPDAAPPALLTVDRGIVRSRRRLNDLLKQASGAARVS
ncbi:Toluene-4-sulfonate monooxygenase system iron-sulfur subunit TsaM1 [Pigmentiphaga humi]|uniref:Toluene-4-sulfonate monooxygenase system iron-sulfur subunit TsaM1 n=1 Tax=Pigmentiphaga humi TaxID=2478468 RepID=A0A3P4AYS5_9BURK|nr:aromatic ring-hydroxylating dioxygenase subunit alpha [Pigmentiphaga humi]VCU69234.1 Toluene-4-sulfonate monooxygenase system iron-sulfur subunit TsaM1 [Pigmentiphaga humi]